MWWEWWRDLKKTPPWMTLISVIIYWMWSLMVQKICLMILILVENSILHHNGLFSRQFSQNPAVPITMPQYLKRVMQRRFSPVLWQTDFYANTAIVTAKHSCTSTSNIPRAISAHEKYSTSWQIGSRFTKHVQVFQYKHWMFFRVEFSFSADDAVWFRETVLLLTGNTSSP